MLRHINCLLVTGPVGHLGFYGASALVKDCTVHGFFIMAIKAGETLMSLKNATQQIPMEMTLQIWGHESLNRKWKGTIFSISKNAVSTHCLWSICKGTYLCIFAAPSFRVFKWYIINKKKQMNHLNSTLPAIIFYGSAVYFIGVGKITVTLMFSE